MTRKQQDVAPLPTGEEKVKAVRSMFDAVAPRYEMLNRFISLGLDQRWRRKALGRLTLASNSLVLDIATGTGDFCRLLESNGHRPIGADLSFGMLEHAHTSAPLMQADALQLPLPDSSVDAVTCGFALRNFVELRPFFDELARVVANGGQIALLDASQPRSAIIRRLHHLWFGVVVPRIGSLLSNAEAYRYLPKSLAYLPERYVMIAMIEEAGFHNVKHESLFFGSAQLITATKS